MLLLFICLQNCLFIFLFIYSDFLKSENNCCRLQIGNEKLFIDISAVLAAAISWEERARRVLRTVAGMYELEDLIRFISFCVFPFFNHSDILFYRGSDQIC